jgi:outer membrane protein TolC
MRRTFLLLAAALAALAAPLGGRLAAQDTLSLPALHDAALRRDPRSAQGELQAAATELRLRNVTAERLPQLTARGEAVYQSEVPALGAALPGADVPRPPRDRYAALIEVEQLLWDGGVRSRRRDAERAQLEVARAELATALHPLRAEVNEAYFRAVHLQERAAETELLMADLDARLAELRTQVRAGAALAGDTAAVLAERLRAEQIREEIAADRRAALALLGELAGRPVAEADVLVLPDLAARVDAAGARRRPEYAAFAARRERLDREAALVSARSRPRVAAFGQAAVGRPGLELFTRDVHPYGQVGLRVEWSPWRWGTTGREEELVRIQQRIVETEEAAFTDRLRRELHDERQTIARLRATLGTDDRIIALHERVERQAAAQLRERAVTAAAYLDARSDLQEARLARRRHVVELARAEAQYLTALGADLH